MPSSSTKKESSDKTKKRSKDKETATKKKKTTATKKAPETTKPRAKKSAVKTEPGVTREISKTKKTGSVLLSAGSGSSSNRRVTSGTNARADRNRLETLGRLIYHRANLIAPGVKFSNKVARTMSALLDDALSKLLDKSLELFGTQGRGILSAQDAFTAVSQVLPQQLQGPAIARATRNIAKMRDTAAALESFHKANTNVAQPEKHFK